MNKVRLIAAAVVALLLIILILQNTEPVETRLLFATVSMPRALLITITALSGFMIGVLAALIFSRKNGPAQNQDAGKTQS